MVVIIGVISVLAIPSLSGMSDMRRAAAADDVERRLLLARSTAMASGASCGLAVNPTTDFVQLFSMPVSGNVPVAASLPTGEPDPGVRLATLYPGADITAITGGGGATGAQTLWFASNGTPELRAANGSRIGGWSGDATIQFAGGARISVLRVTGAIRR